MGCVRLYPDIVVAAEINNTIKIEKMFFPEKNITSVIISLDNMLKCQRDYKQFGIVNCFIGFEDKEWTADDYREFLSEFSDSIKECGNNEYEVDLMLLLNGVLEEDFARQLCSKLFLQGVYSEKVLERLGLYNKNQKNISLVRKKF